MSTPRNDQVDADRPSPPNRSVQKPEVMTVVLLVLNWISRVWLTGIDLFVA